jgi:hypothetical protein
LGFELGGVRASFDVGIGMVVGVRKGSGLGLDLGLRLVSFQSID